MAGVATTIISDAGRTQVPILCSMGVPPAPSPPSCLFVSRVYTNSYSVQYGRAPRSRSLSPFLSLCLSRVHKFSLEQVAAGSVTVAAFLGRKSEVDAVTGHLKLL